MTGEMRQVFYVNKGRSMADDPQFYALTTLLPLILYGIDEAQRLTVRPMSPDDRFGPPPKRGRRDAGDVPLRAMHLDRSIRRRWQVDVVELALQDLFAHNRRMGLAVWYEYVNQWNEYEARCRRKLAEDGCLWMLENAIGVELLAYTPDHLPRELREEERNRHIRRLKNKGWPVKRLANQYGLSPSQIRRIVYTDKKGEKDGVDGGRTKGKAGHRAGVAEAT